MKKTAETTIFSKSYLFCLLVCGIVFCVVLEVAVRFRIEQRFGFRQGSISEMYKYDETTGLRILIPNTEVKGSKTHIRINALGFRGRDLEIKKAQNTIRIAALGASTTFCAEVSNNDSTWLELVGATLTDRFPSHRFEMINGAVPGYGIESSFKRLRYHIMRLNPDIVIFYEAVNEISYQSRKEAIARGILGENYDHHGAPIFSFLSKYSVAFDLLYKNIVILVRQSQFQNSRRLNDFPETCSDSFIAHLDSIRQECNKSGVPLFVFTFSKKFRRHQPVKQRLRNMNTAWFYMPWMAPDTFLDAFDLFNRKAFEFAQHYENVYVDTLHNTIPGDDQHFVDSVHFTDRGCRVMADRVVNALLRTGLVQKAVQNGKGKI